MIHWLWLLPTALVFFLLGAGLMRYQYGVDLDELGEELAEKETEVKKLLKEIERGNKTS